MKVRKLLVENVHYQIYLELTGREVPKSIKLVEVFCILKTNQELWVP